MQAATMPMPKHWRYVGFVSKIATQYVAIIQFGVNPAMEGDAICRIVPMESNKVETVNQRNCPPRVF